MGRSRGSRPMARAQRNSHAIGSEEAISMDKSRGVPLIGPGPSMAVTASTMVRDGLKLE